MAATRGREVNRLYVDTAYDPDPATSPLRAGRAPERDRSPAGVLAREGADLSAHEVRQRASPQAASWAVLAQEYTHDRPGGPAPALGRSAGWLWVGRTGPPGGAGKPSVRAAPGRHAEAEARGLKVGAVLPKLVHARKFDDATDPAAVLHGRVQRWAAAAASNRRGAADLVAGLLPRAAGVADPDMGRALAERDRAMCQRAREIAEEAVRSNQPWVLQLGPPPTEPVARAHWAESVTTVAAYRDRWGVTADDQPLGLQSGAITVERARQRGLAQAAVDRALRLSRQAGGQRLNRSSRDRSPKSKEWQFELVRDGRGGADLVAHDRLARAAGEEADLVGFGRAASATTSTPPTAWRRNATADGCKAGRELVATLAQGWPQDPAAHLSDGVVLGAGEVALQRSTTHFSVWATRSTWLSRTRVRGWGRRAESSTGEVSVSGWQDHGEVTLAGYLGPVVRTSQETERFSRSGGRVWTASKSTSPSTGCPRHRRLEGTAHRTRGRPDRRRCRRRLPRHGALLAHPGLARLHGSRD